MFKRLGCWFLTFVDSSSPDWRRRFLIHSYCCFSVSFLSTFSPLRPTFKVALVFSQKIGTALNNANHWFLCSGGCLCIQLSALHLDTAVWCHMQRSCWLYSHVGTPVRDHVVGTTLASLKPSSDWRFTTRQAETGNYLRSGVLQHSENLAVHTNTTKWDGVSSLCNNSLYFRSKFQLSILILWLNIICSFLWYEYG